MSTTKQKSSKAKKIKQKELDEEEFNKDINPQIREFMIREAFNMFDEDHSGEIDKNEFRTLIASLGLKLTEKQINETMRQMDKDGSGSIDFEEFSSAMRQFQFGAQSSIKQHLESAFNDYDKDMDAFISADDFVKLGEEVEKGSILKEDAELFIQMCKHFGKDKNIENKKDDLISKDEFINFLCCTKFLVDIDVNKKSQHQLGALNSSNQHLERSQGASLYQSEAKNISRQNNSIKESSFV